jgi:hypothetical protein
MNHRLLHRWAREEALPLPSRTHPLTQKNFGRLHRRIDRPWNHLIIQVQRTSSDQLLYQSITLNGKTASINHYENPTSSSSNGITINYQLDGNRYGTPYTVYIDKLNFTVH